MTMPQTGQLRPSTPDRYEDISRHLLQQAEEKLFKGDALQASEKIWGVTAHALKAIAQRRGWNHRFHNHLRAAEFYLAAEQGRPDWHATFMTIDSMHTNFYEHQLHPGDVRPFLDIVRGFCQEILETARLATPQIPELTTEQQSDQDRRLRTLTRPLSEQAAFGEELSPEELED